MRRFVGVLLCLLGRAAAADPLTGPAGEVAPHQLAAQLELESNLSARDVAEPVSLAPDLYLGLPAGVTIGLTTSARALGLVETGRGLCLRQALDRCRRRFDDVAVDVLWHVRRGAIALAPRARLVLRAFEPLKPSLRLGALIGLRGRHVFVSLDPQLALGLYQQELGNRSFVALPLAVGFPLGRVTPYLRGGAEAELHALHDTLLIPVGFGATIGLGAVDLTVELAFPKLLGPQNTFKERFLALALSYRIGCDRDRRR